MNFYNNLNEMIEYLEDNLDKEIDYQHLAKIVGTNLYTLERIFSLISGISLREYIRKRRLTLAGRDLVQGNFRIIDIAYKYGYLNATSFSRAFYKFHGINPSDVKKNKSNLKFYPVLKYEMPKLEEEFNYEIISLNEFELYGIGIKTNNQNIKKDAPNLYKRINKEYPELPHPLYGMIVYDDRFNSDDYEYWVLWDKKYHDFKKQVIKKSRWLKFNIPSQESKDIQRVSDEFYISFLPTCPYELKSDPELEYYHDGITEFLVPIN
ncbi:MAG: AraC family transcriptional regulator [Ruminococcus sp.]|nr:AraC family transcriptional regulator [Ruminococcus sp.]